MLAVTPSTKDGNRENFVYPLIFQVKDLYKLPQKARNNQCLTIA